MNMYKNFFKKIFTYYLNFGPQHPAAHGLFYVYLNLLFPVLLIYFTFYGQLFIDDAILQFLPIPLLPHHKRPFSTSHGETKMNMKITYSKIFLLGDLIRESILFKKLLDGFAVATLLLIFIKFFSRLLGYNPAWQVNLLFLFALTSFSIRFNWSFVVRETMRDIWRNLLPRSFYFTNYFIKANGQSLADKYDEPFVYSSLSFFHKATIKLFFFLIYFRLFILSEAYCYFVLNYLLIYFLIINQLLISSSIIGLIFALSRWTFFLEHKDMKEFKKDFAFIEEFDNDKFLYPNWENAVLVGTFLANGLYKGQELFTKEFPHFRRTKFNQLTGIGRFITKRFEQFGHPLMEKGKHINYHYQEAFFLEFNDNKVPTYEEYPYFGIKYFLIKEDREAIKSDERFVSNKRYHELFDDLIKLKKRNVLFPILLYIIFLVYFTLFSQLFIDDSVLQFFPKPLLPQHKGLFSKLRQVEAQVRIPEHKCAEVLSGITGKPKAEIHDSPLADQHTFTLQFCKDKKVFANSSTHKRSEKNDPEMIKIPIEDKEDYPKKSVLANTKNHDIKNTEFAELVKESFPQPDPRVKNIFEKFRTYVESESLKSEFRNKLSRQQYKALAEPDVDPQNNKFRTEHDNISELRKVEFDDTVSANQAIRATGKLVEYYYVIGNHPCTPRSQRQLYLDQAEIMKNKFQVLVHNAHNNSQYKAQDNPGFNDLINDVDLMIIFAKTNERQNPFVNEILSLAHLKNQSVETVRKDYTNIQHLSNVTNKDIEQYHKVTGKVVRMKNFGDID